VFAVGGGKGSLVISQKDQKGGRMSSLGKDDARKSLSLLISPSDFKERTPQSKKRRATKKVWPSLTESPRKYTKREGGYHRQGS